MRTHTAIISITIDKGSAEIEVSTLTQTHTHTEYKIPIDKKNQSSFATISNFFILIQIVI